MKIRELTFVACMGALGNLLFFLSQTVFNLGQITLDLSHIATYVSALYGGPYLGLLTGLIVGLGPGFYFGYIGGKLGFAGVIFLPLGKCLTGLTAGYLSKRFNLPSSRLNTSLIVMVSYVPECLFTIAFFKVLLQLFLPSSLWYLSAFLIPIMVKAWGEIFIIAFLMTLMVNSKGFSDFVKRFISA